jgi:hypothetical protein
MQAIVEIKNLIIGRALHKRMAEQELLTGVVSKEWVDSLSSVIAAINRKAHAIKGPNSNGLPVCSGQACILLNIGDKVRVALEAPRTATDENKKLPGKFRASDIRWEVQPRTIENIYIEGNQPPTYQVSGRPKVAYTKNRLQLITENKKLPKPKIIQGQPTHYKIEKILEKKKINGIEKLKIKWVGYDDPKDETWETYTKIKEDVPKLLVEFENKNIKPAKPKIKKSKTSVKTTKTRQIKLPSKFKD